jgi:hypothetical protein
MKLQLMPPLYEENVSSRKKNISACVLLPTQASRTHPCTLAFLLGLPFGGLVYWDLGKAATDQIILK